MDFTHLSQSISDLNDSLRGAAASSVNRMLTMRNWLTGMHIVEYEQKGEDRAKYGSELLQNLSETLFQSGIKGFSPTNLRLFRKFYFEYQQLGPLFEIQKKAIGQKATDQLAVVPNSLKISQSSSAKRAAPLIQQLPTAELYNANNNQSVNYTYAAPEKLLRHFSFTHFVELMRLENPLKRSFYEIEGINGCWSVSQLKRQIETLLFERTGVSKDKSAIMEAAHKQGIPATIDDLIRDPYILEFAGFPERSFYSESDLETALLDHIQSFLLELGNGFCFEARQKRITLDNEGSEVVTICHGLKLQAHGGELRDNYIVKTEGIYMSINGEDVYSAVSIARSSCFTIFG